jgi:hypothetical protein
MMSFLAATIRWSWWSRGESLEAGNGKPRRCRGTLGEVRGWVGVQRIGGTRGAAAKNDAVKVEVGVGGGL